MEIYYKLHNRAWNSESFTATELTTPTNNMTSQLASMTSHLQSFTPQPITSQRSILKSLSHEDQNRPMRTTHAYRRQSSVNFKLGESQDIVKKSPIMTSQNRNGLMTSQRYGGGDFCMKLEESTAEGYTFLSISSKLYTSTKLLVL